MRYLSACAAVLLAWAFMNWGAFSPIKYDDGRTRCRYVKGTREKLRGAEDFRLVSKDLYLVSATNVIEVLNEGINAAEGAIALLQLSGEEEKLRVVEIENFPPGIPLLSHGLDFSTRGGQSTLYIVNHDVKNRRERVEIVTVLEKDSFDRLRLVHRGALDVTQLEGSEVGTINSVTETGEGELFLTHWLTNGIPVKGLDHPSGLREVFSNVLMNGFSAFIMGTTMRVSFGYSYVVRCDVKANKCARAEGSRGRPTQNGLCSSPRGDYIYVVEDSTKVLNVYKKESSGKIDLVRTHRMAHFTDNMVCAPVGTNGDFRIYFGTMTSPWSFIVRGATKNPKHYVPGGFTMVDIPRGKEEAADLVFKDVFLHDGSMLSGIATAQLVNDGKEILFGGPLESGMMRCKAE